MTDRIGWTQRSSARVSTLDRDAQDEQLLLLVRKWVDGPDAEAPPRPPASRPTLLRRLRSHRLWRAWRLSVRSRAPYSGGRGSR
ncbi:hypothetical protein [Embleya sp. NPDC005971]|uniref:hypothetical protein n=1 Tax=Embleya sp. NPDC005971 TaxID=3156724 RepID=UPI0033E14CCC